MIDIEVVSVLSCGSVVRFILMSCYGIICDWCVEGTCKDGCSDLVQYIVHFYQQESAKMP